jgi:hypothetical protein
MKFFMKEFCAYILYSVAIQKFYIGAYQENFVLRLDKHNAGYYGKNLFIFPQKIGFST